MSSIDERVVEMQFDNGQFQDGIKDTIGALDKLKTSLNFDNVGNTLEDISSKISVVGAVAFSAIQSLTQSALGLGGQMLNAILDPLIQGGERRALAIEQARFQFRGLGLDVEATMASAREAVLGTAFGLDAAASAAAQFAASGMRAGPEMTSALRAISGVAAQTGSSYEDISRIFIGVSGNARLMGNDLLSLSNRGINAAATLAQSMGISEAEVRALVTKGKISFEEFYQAMDAAFGENATKSAETYTGSLSNMRTAISRIGASFAAIEFEGQRNLFNTLTPMIDKVAEALKPVIAAFGELNAANNNNFINRLSGIDLSFLTPVLENVALIMRNISVLANQFGLAIRVAFGYAFPDADFGQTLQTISEFLLNISDALLMTGTELTNFRYGFQGLFALLDVGGMLLGEIRDLFLEVFGEIFKDASFDIFELIGNVGRMLISFRDTVRETGVLQTAFDSIFNVISQFIEYCRMVWSIVGDVVDRIREFAGSVGDAASEIDVDTSGIEAFFDRIGDRASSLSGIGTVFAAIWQGIVTGAMLAWEVIGPFIGWLGDFFADMGDSIATALQGTDFNAILDTLNIGLLTSIVFMIRDFINTPVNGEGEGGLLDSVKEVVGGLQESLSALTASIKVGTLLLIALAVGVLAASALALATVDSEKLLVSLSAMTIMFGQMLGFLALFDIVSKGAIGVRMAATAAALIVLGIALRIFASSVIALSGLSWEEIAKGLSAVTVMLALMVGVSRTMQGSLGGLTGTAIAMAVLGVALKIMASALGDFAQFNWEELARGFSAVAVAMAIMVGVSRTMQGSFIGLTQTAIAMGLLGIALKIFASAIGDFTQFNWEELGRGFAAIAVGMGLMVGVSRTMQGSIVGLTSSAIAMVIMGAALKVMASAIGDFVQYNWEELARGFSAMAVGLGLIVGAMALMPSNMVVSAVGLLIVASAIQVLANAFSVMAGMSWEEIGRGITVLAGSLVLLVAATMVMNGALAGAAAMIIVAVAITLLAAALNTLGSMSWESVGVALVALAGTFAILAAAGYLLTPTIPTLLGLGAALLLLGAGVMLAGIGVGLLAAGLTALGLSLSAVTVGIVTLLAGIVGLIPTILEQLGYGIVALAAVIAESGPTLVAALVTILLSLIEAIGTIIPPLLELIGSFIIQLLELIGTLLPPLIELVVNILLQLIAALTQLIPDIVNLGVQIILALLEGLQQVVPVLLQTVVVIIKAIVETVVALVPYFVDAGFRLITGVLNGIANNIGKVIDAGVRIVERFMDGIGNAVPRLVQAAADLIVDILDGISQGIEDNAERIRAAGRRLAFAIADGMTGGLASKVQDVIDGAVNLAQGALGAIQNAIDSHSPSRETHKLGSYFGQGFANGIFALLGGVVLAATRVGTGAVTSLRDSLSNMDDALPDSEELVPVVRPVMDLSDIQSKSAEMRGLMTAWDTTFDVGVQERFAQLVARQRDEQREIESSEESSGSVVNVEYTQNNTSPKALSGPEIYRKTKNQISTIKELVK